MLHIGQLTEEKQIPVPGAAGEQPTMTTESNSLIENFSIELHPQMTPQQLHAILTIQPAMKKVQAQSGEYIMLEYASTDDSFEPFSLLIGQQALPEATAASDNLPEAAPGSSDAAPN